jgi:hypothetical protein
MSRKVSAAAVTRRQRKALRAELERVCWPSTSAVLRLAV